MFTFLLILTIWAVARASESPGGIRWSLVGLLCASAVLTRPMAKGLIVVLLVGLWSETRERRRAVAAVALTAAVYVLCLVPWMYINARTYGFVGISRGQGLGLFLRAFDVERLEPPHQTAFPDVEAAMRKVAPAAPYVLYPVIHELSGRHHSAVQIDRAMEGFALEAIRSHPIIYVTGIAADWVELFVTPHRSLDICQDPAGPVMCSRRGLGAAFTAFPNMPVPGFTSLKHAVAAYMDAAYRTVPIAAPLALIGAVRALRRGGAAWARHLRLLLLLSILYVTLVAVSFNGPEDRYRLPIDAFILMFAVHAVAGGTPTQATRQGPHTACMG
jgi:4-amino-4-deoxy-L-arabinose transferase-like glycosyltransferase